MVVGGAVGHRHQEVGREHVREHEKAEVVQQPAQVREAWRHAAATGHAAGEGLRRGARVHRPQPVLEHAAFEPGRHTQRLVERQPDREVDYQVDAEDPHDRVLDRFHRAARPVVGRVRPADHLRGERGVAFDDAGQVAEIEVRIQLQLDDAARRFGQGRHVQRFVQPLADALCRELRDRLVDCRVAAVVVDGACGARRIDYSAVAHEAGEGALVQAQPLLILAGGQEHLRRLQQRGIDPHRIRQDLRDARQHAQAQPPAQGVPVVTVDRAQLATRVVLQGAQIQETVAAGQHLHTADAIAEQYAPGGGRGRVAHVQRKRYLPVFERRATGAGQFAGFHVAFPRTAMDCSSSIGKPGRITRNPCAAPGAGASVRR